MRGLPPELVDAPGYRVKREDSNLSGQWGKKEAVTERRHGTNVCDIHQLNVRCFFFKHCRTTFGASQSGCVCKSRNRVLSSKEE